MRCTRCGSGTSNPTGVCDACSDARTEPLDDVTRQADPSQAAPGARHDAATFIGPAGTDSPASRHDTATFIGAEPASTPAHNGAAHVHQAPATELPTSALRAISPHESVTVLGEGASEAVARRSGAVPEGAAPPPDPPRAGTGPLAPGRAFGTRYQIIKLLGSGGMGAVYQAWDEELGVIVALKVIRPEITNDPVTGPEVERRFKRELVLARQVTHKNVIRIHDLGEIDGIKYITMQYVHGQNLAAMLRHSGKLPVPEALRIGRQIAAGLAAAHEVGVVHRDLKPANVMLDDEANALIVDFGIARSAAAAGTVGVVVGTLEYMSPEQAKGLASDGRSDIYSLGLMLLDMVTGSQRLATAASTMVELMGRMQSAPPPVRTVEPGVPEGLERVIGGCVDPDPERRYKTAAELSADLDRLALGGAEPAAAIGGRRRRTQQIAAAVGAVLVLAGAGLLGTRGRLWHRAAGSPGAPSITMALLPFHNATGDSSLDGLGESVTEMLADDIAQTAAYRVVPSDRILRLLADLRATSMDEATIGRVSDLTNAGLIVSGKLIKTGGAALRVDVIVHDNSRGTDLRLTADAKDQSSIAEAVQLLTGKIAAQSTSAIATAAAHVAPSSRSPQAIREYNLGLQLARDARYADALKQFQAATQSDAGFSLAYSKAAEMLGNLRRDRDAAQMSRRAVDLAANLPEQSRYVVQARDARLNHDNDRAIAAYRQALRSSPADSGLQLEVAALYESTGALDAAHDELARVLAADPKNLDALVAAGRVEIKRKNPQASIDPLNRALALSIQFDNEEARATILNAIGIAYKRLNRPDDALPYYQQSITIKRRLGQKAGVAATLSEIAQIERTKGRTDEALRDYQEALAIRREIGDKRGTANSLIDLGLLMTDRAQYDDALKLYREALQTERDVGDRAYEALCLNNIGTVYLARGMYAEALTNYERALEIRRSLNVNADVAQTLHNIGEASLRQGQYDKAVESYLRALDLWRAAGDKPMAALESYSVGTVFAYQGRVGAALESEQQAVGVIRQSNDRSESAAEILSGYALTLAQAGRSGDARQPLTDALAIARERKNGAAVAQALTAQGMAALYVGEARGARTAFEEASREAARAGAQREMVIAAIGLAKATLAGGEAAKAAATLVTAVRQAEASGLLYESLDAAIVLAEARLATGQRQQAGAELDAIVRRARDAGLKPLVARAEAVDADVLAATGRTADAARLYADALGSLKQMAQESGTPDLMLKRSDLDPIVRKAARAAK